MPYPLAKLSIASCQVYCEASWCLGFNIHSYGTALKITLPELKLNIYYSGCNNINPAMCLQIHLLLHVIKNWFFHHINFNALLWLSRTLYLFQPLVMRFFSQLPFPKKVLTKILECTQQQHKFLQSV